MTALFASALPKTLQDVGAIAGIASCVLVVVLLVLYVIRAIEIHRLRKSMPFLVDPGNGQPPNGGSGRGRGR